MNDRKNLKHKSFFKLASVRLLILLVILSPLPIYAAKQIGLWSVLAEDGLHDRRNKKGLKFKQEPGKALSKLPRSEHPSGNKVDWALALRSGFIEPRSNIYTDTPVRVIDLDVIMRDTSTMNYVRFPHKVHSEWLDCSNCHPVFFGMQIGDRDVNMGQILEGEFCGRCHGAVAFPLTDCNRCHSITQGDFTGTFGAQYPAGKGYEDYAIDN